MMNDERWGDDRWIAGHAPWSRKLLVPVERYSWIWFISERNGSCSSWSRGGTFIDGLDWKEARPSSNLLLLVAERRQ